MISAILFKMGSHSDFHVSLFLNSRSMAGCYSCHNSCLYGFGRRFLKIGAVCMDFVPYFKVQNLVSVRPKSITLGRITNVTMIFHVVVAVYRLIKI